MKRSKCMAALLMLALTATLTGFTPQPQITLYETRSQMSDAEIRYPLVHDIQAEDVFIASLQSGFENEYSRLGDYYYPVNSLTFSQQAPELTTGLPLENAHIIHAYALPVGVSEIEDPLYIHAYSSAPLIDEMYTYGYSSTHSEQPHSIAIYSENEYVTGALCLPMLPVVNIINPLFVTYRHIPINAELQSLPMSQRARAYSQIVETQARRYNLSTSLIYALIQTESAFNPSAVSSMQAHGLMQIVISSAGNEVHNYLGNPSPLSAHMLHNPETNIIYGTTYLHLLGTQHFRGVTNSLSREYCAIAAYNGGSRRVLELFGSGASAIAAINSLSPYEVYQRIATSFPSLETRNFIVKVVSTKNSYYAMGM